MIQIKRNIPVLFFVLTTLTFTSCDKKEEIINIISESDVIEIIETTFQNDIGGLTTNLEDLTEQLIVAVTSAEVCDTTYNNTIEKDHQGAQVQASYTSELTYEMLCNTIDLPQTADFSISTISTYSTPRIESDDSSNFEGNATGLELSSTTLNITGNYNSVGTQDSDYRQQQSISSDFDIDLTSLKIDKQSRNIESGSGIFLFTASQNGDHFSYSGTITFNGNNTATIVINETTYEVDWN